MSLTREQRQALPESAFAVPERRLLPIPDERHVRMAWSQLPRTAGLSEQERGEARARIIRKAHDLGISTDDWELKAFAFDLEAMSLGVPDEAHPNRMPFTGVLTRVDEPSDNPPHGSSGRRTLIPKDVAERALSSLLGMAVDYTADFDGHDRKAKIGLITEATIQGNAICIAGFLYAADFPEECARIKAETTRLGFSYECQAAVDDPDADPWEITYCVFTGAAVLYKHLAAYTTTSLAAKAEQEHSEMELKDIMEAVKGLTTAVGDLTKTVNAQGEQIKEVKASTEKAALEAGAAHDTVKPHADKLRACAAAMEAAGIGGHHENGHVKVLNHMASQMEADAVMGRIPHVYRSNDYLSAGADKGKNEPDPALTAKVKELGESLESVTTLLKDVQAKAFKEADSPQRKTISPEIASLLAKHNLSAAAEDGSLTIVQVDKALEGLPREQRMAQKLKLMASGVLPAAKAD